MTESAADWVALGRATVGVAADVPGQAWLVRRLDRVGAYYLVLLGPPEAHVAIVAIDSDSRETLEWARLSGKMPHLTSKSEALARAHLGSSADAELVWRASAPSRSPLYPLWEVRSGRSVVYIDQQGKLWQNLAPAGRGG